MVHIKGLKETSSCILDRRRESRILLGALEGFVYDWDNSAAFHDHVRQHLAVSACPLPHPDPLDMRGKRGLDSPG
jgi:hypothetical protein